MRLGRDPYRIAGQDRDVAPIREDIARRSLSEIIASKPTANFDARFKRRSNADEFIDRVYAHLARPERSQRGEMRRDARATLPRTAPERRIHGLLPFGSDRSITPAGAPGDAARFADRVIPGIYVYR
ncbi:MAG: hypothetical protein R3F21_24910 [Myxococcota bacterium]